MPNEPQCGTLVGAIIGAHGIQGSVKVKLATPTALALITPPKRVNESEPRPFIEAWVGTSPTEGKTYRIYSAKRQEPKEILLVKLGDVDTRAVAQSLIGQRLYGPDDKRLPLEADEFFVTDLIGLDVVTDLGTPFGKVVEVMSEPANDVYETDTGALIPAVKEFVLNVDLAERRIIVREVAGLMPDKIAAPEAQVAVSSDSEQDSEQPLGLAKIGKRRFGAKR